MVVWMDVPGWTAPATRSPAPDRLSPAFWVVDFWESGVTGDVLMGEMAEGGRGRAYSSRRPARRVPCEERQT
jgi:hypothetical protein